MRWNVNRCWWCAKFLTNNCGFTERTLRTVLTCVRKYSSYPVKKLGVREDSPTVPPFPPVYNAAKIESEVYDWWEKEGFFKPKSRSSTADTFSMVLPPPNVTGTLHLGHALTATIQDVLARWHRMHGRCVCWVPGMDHAGIATQVAVEKKLWQERRLTRHDIGREEFEKEVWKWKHQKAEVITRQLRELGASLDWSRHVFTMNPAQSSAVVEAFIRLYEGGLIYRAKSLVNWSCILQSAISDIEVTHKEVKSRTMFDIPGYEEPVEFGVLTNFAYKIIDCDEEIVVSTTRVETIPGDVAIAVHPGDDRYKKWHGARVWHPFREESIPVICDEFVDPTFGTGAVKITPAHSSIDYEVAKRHNLSMISVISEDGMLNDYAKPYSGMKRFDARRVITEDLKRRNLFRGQKEHITIVPVCSRSGDAVEYLLKSQWFVNCKEMGRKAAASIRNGDLKIEPATFEKTWFTWLDNIKDWCISRQLWWGHRIPMYQCHSKGDVDTVLWVAARSTVEARRKASQLLGLDDDKTKHIEVSQDTDVLDTWFSSALFPFTVHGWPAQSENLSKFYPLSLMETGHDILFFWVARMVMLGTYCTGAVPFKKVLLHGIICDAVGRKMSKSLGNVIDPGDVINGISLEGLSEKVQHSYKAGLLSESELQRAVAGQKKLFPDGIPQCGTDALRFTLCSQNVTSFFINFDVNTCAKNRAFCNKVWQACKYVHQCVTRVVPHQAALRRMDRWILSRLACMVAEMDEALHNMQFHCATAALKTFLYDEFCDIYLETTKPVMRSNTSEAGAASWTLLQCTLTALRALSPFMPFITEELYQRCVQLEKGCHERSVMIAPYPKPEEWSEYRDENLENEFDEVYSVVLAIRRLRSLYNIKTKMPEVYVVNDAAGQCELIRQYTDIITTLARCGTITISQELPGSLLRASVAETAGANSSVHIVVKGKDTEVEKDEIGKKYKILTKDLDKMLKITSQAGYKSGAPREVQDMHRKKIESLEAELEKLRQYQDSLKRLDEVIK
ncbi:valine--tRNA ligase [Anabrus simplex]|uniref:valine--tRNA ligase n=1 Tax=Anabrus simplex TaxID=316456 RepID=UPI0035A2F327